MYKHAKRKLFTRIQETVFYQKVNAKLQPMMQDKHLQQQSATNNDIHQLCELLEISDHYTNSNTYTSQAYTESAELTYSMVEMPKFRRDEESIPPSSETETVSELQKAEDNGVPIQAKVNVSVQRDEHESKKLQSQFETDNIIENLGNEMCPYSCCYHDRLNCTTVVTKRNWTCN